MSWEYGGWPKSKTVAERRADAAQAIAKGGQKGAAFAPVVVEGRTIAKTFSSLEPSSLDSSRSQIATWRTREWSMPTKGSVLSDVRAASTRS